MQDRVTSWCCDNSSRVGLREWHHQLVRADSHQLVPSQYHNFKNTPTLEHKNDCPFRVAVRQELFV